MKKILLGILAVSFGLIIVSCSTSSNTNTVSEEISTDPPSITASPTPTIEQPVVLTETIEPTPSPEPLTATPPPDAICNGPDEAMTILVVGTDARWMSYLYGMADSIMIMRVDFVRGEVALMGIPRGLWVEIPDIEDDIGLTHGKITQAYFYGTEGMSYYSGTGFGAGLLKETINQNYGIEIDKHIVVNMTAFVEIIDIIGGIKVYNPYTLYSYQDTEPKLAIGGYVFSGYDALMYARHRDPRNVLDRVDRQAIVMKAVHEQVYSLSIIPKIPKIIGVLKDNVLTDLSLAEISQLACMAGKTDLDEVIFTRIPKDLLEIANWEGSPWIEKEPGSVSKVLKDFDVGIYPEE